MAHSWAAARKAGGAGGDAGDGGNGGGGGGGALSRFTASDDGSDDDSRAESDSGANESMDEDVASVASSQGDS